MTFLLAAALALTAAWALLEDYWRRHHREREAKWRAIAADALKNAGELRETLRQDRRLSRKRVSS